MVPSLIAVGSGPYNINFNRGGESIMFMFYNIVQCVGGFGETVS